MFSSYKKASLCVALFAIVLLVGCGGGSSTSTSSSNLPIAVAVINSAPLLSCQNNGITFQTGIDANSNQVLDEGEILKIQYVCNGVNGISGTNGSNGTNGINGADGVGSIDALLSLVSEASGINCTVGGSKVNVGLDLNRNQILDASEILSHTFICNGSNGLVGATGATGINGTTGAVGATGATGATGSAGATGAVGATGAAGINGDVGTTGAVGATGAAGTNGVVGTTGAVGATGATGSAGTNGLTTLLTITSELAGGNCLYGGAKTTSGPDTNSNQILDVSEIAFTKYICNGATGADGAVGATGAKGDTGATGGSISAFAYVYNTAAQTVALASVVLFDSNGALKGVEHLLNSGTIKIVEAGTYLISFSISGTEPNQFAIFVNGVVASGSIYGTGAGTQPNNGQVILVLNANSLLTLVNYTSAAAVGLQALAGGSKANVNASVVIQRLD